MSISNRHPIVRQIVNDLANIKKIKSKWTIVFFETKQINPENIFVKNHFYKTTIESINKHLVLDKIFVYIRQNIHTTAMFDSLCKEYPATLTLIELPIGFNHNSVTLVVIKNIINNTNSNIIFFQDGYGYLDISKKINYENSPFTQTCIYANIISNTDDNIYNDIMKKFSLEKLILPNVLIIPFNKTNGGMIEYALNISNGLQSHDNDLVTSISLTVVSIKKNGIKNIHDTILSNNFVLLAENKNIYNTIRELAIIGSTNFNTKLSQEIISFDNPDYIYYPYMDLDLMPTNIIDRTNISDFPAIFNTNGFSFGQNNEKSIYDTMFKRFNNTSQGIFIKKSKSKSIIPKILHHFWINEPPSQNYTNAWARILREPWIYIVWTVEKLLVEFADNNWLKLYNIENNYNTKLLLIYIMVLEKYGGIAINSFSLPLKLITDDFLSNKCVVSFYNEANQQFELSNRMMALVPGISCGSSKTIDYDAATRPFRGSNAFFRDMYFKNKEKFESNRKCTDDSDEPVIYPQFYDRVRRNFCSNSANKMESFKNILLKDPAVTIYPSYYFDPNIELFPHKLSKLAFFINLWKPVVSEDVPIKTELKRTYKITPGAMVARLKENPRDRLLNERK